MSEENDSDGNGDDAVRGEAGNVPAGVWVNVPKGMVMAPGTYVDDAGVLRSVADDSCVVWHHNCKFHGRCEKRGTLAHQIIYDPETQAPWCPDCFGKSEEDEERKQQRAEIEKCFEIGNQ